MVNGGFELVLFQENSPRMDAFASNGSGETAARKLAEATAGLSQAGFVAPADGAAARALLASSAAPADGTGGGWTTDRSRPPDAQVPEASASPPPEKLTHRGTTSLRTHSINRSQGIKVRGDHWSGPL